MSLESTIARQRADLQRLERSRLERLKPLFYRVRRQLATELRERLARNTEETFTILNLRATIAQADDAIAQIRAALNIELDGNATLATRTADKHAGSSSTGTGVPPVNPQTPSASSAPSADNLSTAAGTFPVQAIDIPTASRFLDADSTLFERNRSATARWAGRAGERMKEFLVAETLKKSSIDRMVDNLTGPGGPLEGSRWEARRLVTTELMHHYNRRYYEDIQATAAAQPNRGIRKQLLNPIDNRTADDTLAIMAVPGNLVRDIDEPFEDPMRGTTFMHPPNRPNDRATVAAYYPDDPDHADYIVKSVKRAEAEIEKRAALKKVSVKAKPPRKRPRAAKPPRNATPGGGSSGSSSGSSSGTGVPPVNPKPTSAPAVAPSVASNPPIAAQSTPAPLTPGKLEIRLREIEATIIELEHERGISLDEYGREVLRKDGDVQGIGYTPDERLRMEDTYLTHNHPGGTGLSHYDILFAVANNLREIRAVGIGRHKHRGRRLLYRLRRPAAGWIDGPVARRLAHADYIRYYLIPKHASEVREALARRFARGRLTSEATDYYFSHELMKKLASSLGYSYSVRSIK